MNPKCLLVGTLMMLAWVPAKAQNSQLASCSPLQILPVHSFCYLLPPADTGAVGENADVPSWVLTPDYSVLPRRMLVLVLNSSGAHPGVSNQTTNFYLAANSLGYHVIALSYASDKSLHKLCGDDPSDASCYFPSRQTIITGVYQTGAAKELKEIVPTEGIAPRLTLALQKLAQVYPEQGWGNFLTSTGPAATVVWDKVVVSGHSQGGGHAAAIARLVHVARVIQLSSTCDETHSLVDERNATPTPWLNATVPPGGIPWQTDPSTFWGLDAATLFDPLSGQAVCPLGGALCGDETCFSHAAAWDRLGMILSHQLDNASICNVTNAHDASIKCELNYPLWHLMLQ